MVILKSTFAINMMCSLSFLVGAIPLTNSYSNYIWAYGILDPNCTGIESVIWNCSLYESNSCTRYYDAGVICQSMDYIIVHACIICHYDIT